MGGDRWGWNLIGSQSVDFCVWALIQDGLHVRPFDIHPDGNERLRQAGMDAAGWTQWFETVVNRDVDFHERLRLGGDLEPMSFYASDPPTICGAVAGVVEGLWDDYSSQPVLRRNRRMHHHRDGEEPGTAEQHGDLYGALHDAGSDLPSLLCYPVAYPALVVREVAPMALVLTSPKQWTWERYREALLAGVASLAGSPKA